MSSKPLTKMSGLPESRPLRTGMRRKVTIDPVSRDFTIVVDGKEFKSRRQLLSAASKYFDAMFRSNMKETQEGRVELTDMRSKTFATVLKFIHRRVPGLTADNIDDVWEAANRLDTETYLQVCEQFVIDNLSLDNFSHFYQAATDFNSKNVKDAMLSFMKRNFEQVYTTEEFLNLSFPVVLSFVEDDELNVASEEVVLDGILCWVSRGRYRPGTALSPDDKHTGEEAGDTDDQSDDDSDDWQYDDFTDDWEYDDDGQSDDSAAFGDSGDSIQTKDVTSNNSGLDHPADERADYLAKLFSSAKMVLASQSYLQSLLTNPYVCACPSALEVVQEALKFKVGVYPHESSLLIPYRKSCGKRNVVASVVNSDLRLYDLESRSLTSVKLNQLKGRSKTNVPVVSLGSQLAFVCLKFKSECSYAKHKCRPKAIHTVDENQNISTLYEVCGNQNMPITLVSVNGKVLNVCHCATRSRVVDPDLFQILQLDQNIKFKFTCVFDNTILLFKNSDFYEDRNRTDNMTVNCYSLESKSISTVEIPNQASNQNIVAVHKDKHLYLLLSSGALLSVSRGGDNTIQFTVVNHLWRHFDLMLSGAVCYKDELIMFLIDDGTDYSTMLTSLPGLFEKISVEVLEEDFDVMEVSFAPMVVPDSWVSSAEVTECQSD
ncbi:uncharacterized protein LOC131941260 [Physella acuta]|uniref:uncharacterized protein LOC131941260 n=1 Tax=Physella acuta TaxID=109671 RepID=UPI0027DC7D55|nr:uncharacterized protein LOC131941260 [Physella acuta]